MTFVMLVTWCGSSDADYNDDDIGAGLFSCLYNKLQWTDRLLVSKYCPVAPFKFSSFYKFNTFYIARLLLCSHAEFY